MSFYQSSLLEQEISCVMSGLDKEFLENSEKLKEILIKISQEENFNILKTTIHEISIK